MELGARGPLGAAPPPRCSHGLSPLGNSTSEQPEPPVGSWLSWGTSRSWGPEPGQRRGYRGSEAPLDVEENAADFSDALSLLSPLCQGKGTPLDMPSRPPGLPRVAQGTGSPPPHRHSLLRKEACDSQVQEGSSVRRDWFRVQVDEQHVSRESLPPAARQEATSCLFLPTVHSFLFMSCRRCHWLPTFGLSRPASCSLFPKVSPE